MAYLQEKGGFALTRSEQLFAKSASSLRRNITNLNSYLPADKQIVIDGVQVSSTLRYQDYLMFVQQIKVNNYLSSPTERVMLMLIHAFFDLELNMTRLYQEIGMSLTTKKNDSKKLTEFLERHGLGIEVIAKRGIRIVGDESRLRVQITAILMHLTEITPDNHLIERKANNPLERMIFQHFNHCCQTEIIKGSAKIQAFIQHSQLHLSYPSRKFIFIYVILSLFRQEKQLFSVTKEFTQLAINSYRFFDSPSEDQLFSHLIASMDIMNGWVDSDDLALKQQVASFIEHVQQRITTHFYHRSPLISEVYNYLYKCIIRHHYQYSFHDKFIKLEDTRAHYQWLYDVVTTSVSTVEQHYHMRMTPYQLSTLTLIFRKYTMNNKVIGRNTKRLLIVSNAAVEKINFFTEILSHYVDINVIGCFNINELDEIRKQPYDFIVVFSNRIALLLEEYGFSCIKLSFYFNHNDIDSLLAKGFSTSIRRKILSSSFINDIAGKTPEQIQALLLDKYASHFV